MSPYPVETILTEGDGDPIRDNVNDLAAEVVGHRIVKAEQDGYDFVLTLDNGKVVKLAATSDCCAYTELEGFLLNPELVDHVITGVGTTDGATTWHVYADMGDVLKLTVGWSEGSGYYGYGFNITVEDVA